MMGSASDTGFEVLAASDHADRERWEDLVRQAPASDVYYRPGYAAAYEIAEPTRAVAALVSARRSRFLLPLMLRQWRPASGSTAVLDAYSPYGYGGWLPLDGSQASPEEILAALDQVKLWCREQGITSCVLRLHPLLKQLESFSPLPVSPDLVLAPSIPTRAIDLSCWDESTDRPADLAKRRRSYLNSAARGIEVRLWTGEECAQGGSPYLRDFSRIYETDMERLQAPGFLRFPEEYFQGLARGLGQAFTLALAYRQDVAVGGVIFLFQGDFAHYHLSAASDEGRQSGCTTLLIITGARQARARGAKWLHLGGGMRPDDGLFRFKSSFGGQTFDYSTVTLIANQSRYQACCGEEGAPWPYFRPRGA